MALDSSLLDNPLLLSVLFHPRSASRLRDERPGVTDGEVAVAEDAALGYRLYSHAPGSPIVLFFHGNGEIAPDYDGIAPMFHGAGVSLLVLDYRGYGWSSGEPKITTLLPDAEAVFRALPRLLAPAGLAESPRFVMGRSLGSAPAIHLAHLHPDAFAGLIVESGFAHTVPLLAQLGLPVEALAALPDPFDNAAKVGELHLPLLVIHGERDRIVPVGNGQALYDASPAADRTLARVPGAGHNDLLFVAPAAYFNALRAFVERAVSKP